MWDEITYAFPNFNDYIVEVWECSLGMDMLFHPTPYWACDYLAMLGSKSIHVSKMVPECHKMYQIRPKYILNWNLEILFSPLTPF